MLNPKVKEYRGALETLRAVSKSGEDRGPAEVLLRTVAVSRPAARSVVKLPLRTRAQRRQAVIDAARAIDDAAEPEAAE